MIKTSIERAQFNLLLESQGSKLLSLHAVVDEEKDLDPSQRKLVGEWLQGHGILLFKEPEIKEALYHHEKGRRYRPTRHEIEKNEFLCPSCKIVLVKKIYKLRTPLLTCPECRWSIRRDDIFSPEPEQEPVIRQPGEMKNEPILL